MMGIFLFSFIALFFWLIRTKRPIFKNKKRFIEIQLFIVLGMSLLLFFQVGAGLLMLFLLAWIALGFGSYFIYLKLNEKVGFIGSSCCLFFMMMFAYMEFSLLNFI